ncbi:MAG: S8 family serine peptidase [Holophagales bacterium]|nr:S8 family serine peptidase [Holophagales bacterium]
MTPTSPRSAHYARPGRGVGWAAVLLLLAALPAEAQPAPSPGGDPAPARLLIKVDPELGAHWDAGKGGARLGESAAAEALDAFLGVQGLRLEPATRFSRQRIEALEAQARSRAARLGKSPRSYGLAGAFWVEAPWLQGSGADPRAAAELRLQLERLDAVAYARLVSRERPAPPFDVAPATPDLEAEQGYLDRDPGVDIRAAWELGARGQGVTVADVEYAWHPEHEEWNDRSFLLVPGLTPVLGPDHDYAHHGTAVAGVLFGGDNGYGITGLVPDLDAFYAASEDSLELGHDRYGAILAATSVLDPGDVLVLEMQTANEEPAEMDPLVWDATRLATDLGLTVVAAAGTGGHDLDDPAYAAYHAMGDSGAIVVGAGQANTEHRRLGFSCHGTRVDVQAWGTQVLTAGATGSSGTTNLWINGAENEQSYSLFNGTSSATPIVAGVVAAIQSFAQSEFGTTLGAEEMRDLLIATGRMPPGGDEGIGPIPDTRAALAELVASLEPGRAVAGFTTDLVAVDVGGTVQFSDRTVAPEEGTFWSWSFPGGNPAFSWGPNPPPVTYGAAGTYGATLQVLSAAGWDVESRSDVVRVGSPQSQTSGAARLCGVTLRDSGGFDPMGVSEDLLLTLVPDSPGQRVALSFQDVDLWDHPVSCHLAPTRLDVHHGTSTADPTDGWVCGSDLPAPVVSTDAGGALTLRTYSRTFDSYDGFRARVDCLPADVCPAAGSSSDHGWISAVHVSGNFSHFTGPEPGGYTAFEEPIIQVPAFDLADNWISILLETGYAGRTAWPFWWKVWIDYDRDGVFEEPDELFADTGFAWPYGSPWDWFVEVPAGVEGLYRMRVSMKQDQPPGPCETFDYGEVEDYWIHFPPRSGIPPGPGGKKLSNGVPESGIGGRPGETLVYGLELPERVSLLEVTLRGGSGNGDLFVVHEGSQPVVSCASTGPENEERCLFTAPPAGRFRVRLSTDTGFADATLVATFR